MYTKKNARVTFKSNRRPNFRRNNNFSNGKVRNKGNITQQYNKYLKLAKEAFTSGDRIQSEYYYQFTDHYYRLMVELGIHIDENSSNIDIKNFPSTDNQDKMPEVDKENNSAEETASDENLQTDLKKENENDNDNDQDVESIESIPFIAEPAKKKRTRTTK
tara:strand:+ start:7206 stop:7688 length:483 start_codon:yes stop_codon:yes gene_type:complete